MSEEMKDQETENQEMNAPESTNDTPNSKVSLGKTEDTEQSFGSTGYSYGQTGTDSMYENNTAYATAPIKAEPGIGFGIASLVLGIISLLLFCTCINVPMAIIAIIFGIIQLVRGNGKLFSIFGIVTATLSIIAFIVICAIVGFNMPKFSDMSDLDSYMKQYEKEFDNYKNDTDSSDTF